MFWKQYAKDLFTCSASGRCTTQQPAFRITHTHIQQLIQVLKTYSFLHIQFFVSVKHDIQSSLTVYSRTKTVKCRQCYPDPLCVGRTGSGISSWIFQYSMHACLNLKWRKFISDFLNEYIHQRILLFSLCKVCIIKYVIYVPVLLCSFFSFVYCVLLHLMNENGIFHRYSLL